MKIYADRAYLPDGARHVELLFPFWGAPAEDGRYDRYVRAGPEIFELAPLVEAELAIFPAKWEDVADPAGARELARAARTADTRAAVFFWSDSDEPVPVAESLVFRTSLRRSRRAPGEFAMPAWSEDPGSGLPLRSKLDKPLVGFCGYVPRPGLAGRLRGVGRGHAVRARALRALSRSPAVATRFVLRDRFHGGSRREFNENLLGTDYTLCTRGAGNFSYRLYETLSCGRIPVFVNTDCVLPYEVEIDWRSLCVWVDESELDSIGERVAAFHEGLSDTEFQTLQRECRRVWERWLSPEGFFANLHRLLP